MNPVVLGNRIREARKTKGLSQKKLAELIGIEQQSISLLEQGKRGLDVVYLPVLAEILNVSLLYFFGDDLPTTDLVSEVTIELDKLPDESARQSALKLLRLYCDALQNRPLSD